MADDADVAGERQEIEVARALAAVPKLAGKSLAECVKCGDDIPKARQMAVPGCRMCIYCASAAEGRRHG